MRRRQQIVERRAGAEDQHHQESTGPTERITTVTENSRETSGETHARNRTDGEENCGESKQYKKDGWLLRMGNT